MDKKYDEALGFFYSAETDADRSMLNRKNSLLIRCFLEMGNAGDAVSLAEKNLTGLIDSDYGEQVFLAMVRHYYRQGNLQQFERFSRIMAKYSGNEPEISYMSGKLYFQAGNYHAAYNHFSYLTRIKTPHQDEALYFMGLYSLLVTRNAGTALTFFTRINDIQEADETVKRKALIQCAIIYRELNNNEKAQECLNTVMEVQHRGLTHIQAINLFNEFNYSAK